ncbi:MAG: glycosyltransferase [Candidatus Hodarchaeota archaeon]
MLLFIKSSKLSTKDKLKKFNFLYQTNVLIKAMLQEHKASSGLAYYRRQAIQKRISLLEGKTLVDALRKRLKARGVSQTTKQKGNLHIFLAYYISNWESILPWVLKSFGKVTEFEWRSYGFDDRSLNWLAYRERMNDAMLNSFYKGHNEQPVDIVVGYLSGHNTNPSIVRKMGQSGAIIFNFCWDDKLNFPGKILGGRYTSPAAIASAVDLNLTNSPDSVIKYMLHGGLAIFWPEGAHPDIHKPYNLHFDYDVSFVGTKYSWRPKFIEKLRKMGITVVTFGNGWENGPLSNEEMVKLYSRSRINLGFASIGHSKKLMCLKGRDFEVPMSGGLYLTQHNPELSLVYDVGKEIITYRDERDCAEKIRYLLNHTEETARIRKAGRERALKDHTWEKRFEKIFEMVGLLNPINTAFANEQ